MIAQAHLNVLQIMLEDARKEPTFFLCRLAYDSAWVLINVKRNYFNSRIYQEIMHNPSKFLSDAKVDQAFILLGGDTDQVFWDHNDGIDACMQAKIKSLEIAIEILKNKINDTK